MTTVGEEQLEVLAASDLIDLVGAVAPAPRADSPQLAEVVVVVEKWVLLQHGLGDLNPEKGYGVFEALRQLHVNDAAPDDFVAKFPVLRVAHGVELALYRQQQGVEWPGRYLENLYLLQGDDLLWEVVVFAVGQVESQLAVLRGAPAKYLIGV